MFFFAKWPNEYIVEKKSIIITNKSFLSSLENDDTWFYESITNIKSKYSLLGLFFGFLGWFFNYKHEVGNVTLKHSGVPYKIVNLVNYKEFVREVNRQLNK